MSITDVERSITLEEYLALPEDGYRHEVSRGRLIREPQPGDDHGEICAQITGLLHDYLKQNPIGRLRVSSGVLLSREPLTVRGPDVSFVSASRLAYGKADPFFNGAPDLAVEVVSPSNRAAALLEKIAEYFAAEAKVVWVVYSRTKSIAVHLANGEVSIVAGDEVLTALDVLPGFSVPAYMVFE
jgi:Uma2 family endonuclease